MGAKCRVTTGKARGSFSVIRIYKQWVQTRCISSHGVVFVIVIVVLRGVGGGANAKCSPTFMVLSPAGLAAYLP